MPGQSELALVLDLVPEPLRWLAAGGIGIGAGIVLVRRYLAERNAPPPERRATIEGAAIAEPAAQRLANELLSDLRTELRSIRVSLERMEHRQADEMERRAQFERAEFQARLKLLEAAAETSRRRT